MRDGVYVGIAKTDRSRQGRIAIEEACSRCPIDPGNGALELLVDHTTEPRPDLWIRYQGQVSIEDTEVRLGQTHLGTTTRPTKATTRTKTTTTSLTHDDSDGEGDDEDDEEWGRRRRRR